MISLCDIRSSSISSKLHAWKITHSNNHWIVCDAGQLQFFSHLIFNYILALQRHIGCGFPTQFLCSNLFRNEIQNSKKVRPLCLSRSHFSAFRSLSRQMLSTLALRQRISLEMPYFFVRSRFNATSSVASS